MPHPFASFAKGWVPRTSSDKKIKRQEESRSQAAVYRVLRPADPGALMSTKPGS